MCLLSTTLCLHLPPIFLPIRIFSYNPEEPQLQLAHPPDFSPLHSPCNSAGESLKALELPLRQIQHLQCLQRPRCCPVAFLVRQVRALNLVLLHSCLSFTTFLRELVRNADSEAPPRPIESECQEVEPSILSYPGFQVIPKSFPPANLPTSQLIFLSSSPVLLEAESWRSD